jgi:glycerophosphoryl diester phosphodiesterase
VTVAAVAGAATPAPLVIAHRGACWDRPENTLAAFERAIELGAYAIEFDVQATRDGELVILHDRVRPAYTELRRARPDVPTLDEVLDRVGGRIGLAVELKHPGRYPRHRLTARTLAALDAHGVPPGSVTVVSFAPAAIAETRRLRPELRTVQHVGRASIRRAATYAWGVGFDDRWVTRRGIALARRLGLATTVYTVNDPARMRALVALGVDGIFTDRPDVLRALLAGAQPVPAPAAP